jgi:iron complex outermembrane receptor protein
LFLRLTNLLDEEVRLHTSTLKDIAPLGGRAFMVGVTGAF